ncbi:lytic murein transglycosylase (plasmid) [Nocardiopsis eucommiae]|uniref:Lytic murein transglycosylase n=1 Tax=Nocardiopsis eucommiae TaxID=2831970 RepID=A0A975LDK5_9ACTN|nr:lytic murein transglycosylase [Nocardiopsis eucommiae]
MIGLALFALIIPFMLISMLTSQNTGPQGMPSQVEGIHPVLLNAYGQAADRASEIESDCQGMRWSILAGIGQKESNHALGSSISASGDTDPRIIGPRLDGSGAGGNTTAFPDTDLGVWDGDTDYDRAVGPMQFIPSSWVIYGQDGNGDGEKDPHNVFDATLAAVAHLCGNGPWDFTKRDDLRQALWNYNNSNAYVESVLSNIDNYDSMTVVFMGDGNISHHASNVPATGATYQCAPHGELPS